MLKENNHIREIVGIKDLHERGYTGKNIKVAIVDEFDNDETNTTHGENVLASLLEYAPDVDYKLLWFNGKGSNKQACIDWIKENKPDLINVSLAGTEFEARDFLQLKDFVLFCGVGNKQKNRPIDYKYYPASFPFTISVGSYSLGLGRRANFSVLNEDIMGIVPSIKASDGKIWEPFGVSFATPAIVGMMACYLQYKKLNKQEIIGFIQANKSDKGYLVMPKVDDMKIILKIGSKTMYVDGEEKEIDVAPFIKDSRTFVPVRFVSEELGCKVDYTSNTDGTTDEVIITKG